MGCWMFFPDDAPTTTDPKPARTHTLTHSHTTRHTPVFVADDVFFMTQPCPSLSFYEFLSTTVRISLPCRSLARSLFQSSVCTSQCIHCFFFMIWGGSVMREWRAISQQTRSSSAPCQHNNNKKGCSGSLFFCLFVHHRHGSILALHDAGCMRLARSATAAAFSSREGCCATALCSSTNLVTSWMAALSQSPPS